MADRCAPPEGTKPCTSHILTSSGKFGNHPRQVTFIWTGKAWTSLGASISDTPERVYELGWRYVGPADANGMPIPQDQQVSPQVLPHSKDTP